MRETFLPFARPSIGDGEIAEITDSLRSGWITTGPKVERFSHEFAAYVGGRHAAAVSSATAGLHLALLAHGIGPGDEVITSAMTFAATVNVILHAGATPVLADVDRHTLQIRVEEIERRLTPRTRAIVPVHFAGQPSDLDPIVSIASRRGCAVIEDAAHAAGTEYKGRRIGSFPTTSVFSFHPNKNMTTGEGGMVVTDREEVFERVALLRFHGMDRNAWKRFDKSGSHRYDITDAGYKYNMMDIQAALGLHQLPRLDGFIEERRRQAAVYAAALRDVPGVMRPVPVPYPARHAWHLYTPLLDLARLAIDRDRFITELKTRNIGAGLHYTAVHEFSYYAKRFGWRPEDYPEAHFVSDRILSLPLFPGLQPQDQADVVEAVVDVVRRHGR
ncbi:MAG TPA: DegT/DnrJ/EryC1/StrS aminotransferase family protein [Patescibacteria group bacterium]|nr:DegT/DnrJ/EryC1/StrS aminotransferase family protein [Patescibacteria group bacterium]